MRNYHEISKALEDTEKEIRAIDEKIKEKTNNDYYPFDTKLSWLYEWKSELGRKRDLLKWVLGDSF